MIKRIFQGLLLFALAFYSLHLVWPFIYTEPEQDACSFGTVSNEKYREYLAEMNRRTREDWPIIRIWPSLGQSNVDPRYIKLKKGLAQRFDDAMKDVTSFYDRLAIAHAIMRASGMKFRSMRPYKLVKQDDYENGISYSSIGYSYSFSDFNLNFFNTNFFQDNYFASFSFLLRNEANSSRPEKTKSGMLAVNGHYTGPKLIYMPRNQAYFTFFPTFPVYREGGPPCPTVPSKAWVKAYIKILHDNGNTELDR